MRYVYVLDTETSTVAWSDGVPDGHIVEIGVARVDLDELKVEPLFGTIVRDAKASKNAWVFRNTTLTREEVLEKGNEPDEVANTLGRMLLGCEVTSYNIAFDKMMLERDMPMLAESFHWGQDIMIQASLVEEIPRTHGGSDRWPRAEASYNYLCPDDPCNLKGHEMHRAIADAEMEGYILLELFVRGLWKPREVISTDQ